MNAAAPRNKHAARAQAQPLFGEPPAGKPMVTAGLAGRNSSLQNKEEPESRSHGIIAGSCNGLCCTLLLLVNSLMGAALSVWSWSTVVFVTRSPQVAQEEADECV